MTPKEFDKLIKASPFAAPSLRKKLLAGMDDKKVDTGGRNQKISCLFFQFVGCAFFLLSMLAIYIIGALLF